MVQNSSWRVQSSYLRMTTTAMLIKALDLTSGLNLKLKYYVFSFKTVRTGILKHVVIQKRWYRMQGRLIKSQEICELIALQGYSRMHV